MSLGRHHRPLVPLVLGVAFVMIATLFTSQAAIAATPSVRLLVASTELTAERNKRDVVFVDPGAYITPVGEDFELIVNRPDYDTPITAKQVDPNSGLILRTFPDDRPGRLVWPGRLRAFHGGQRPRRHRRQPGRELLPVRLRPAVRREPAHIDLPVRLLRIQPLLPRDGLGHRHRVGERARRRLLLRRRPRLEGQGRRVHDHGSRSIPSGSTCSSISAERRDRRGARLDRWIAGRCLQPARRLPSPQTPAAVPFASTPIVTQPDPATLPDFSALPAWGIRRSNAATSTSTPRNGTRGPGRWWSTASAAMPSRRWMRTSTSCVTVSP